MTPARPRINRLFRFQWEPAQQAHVLLYPEGMAEIVADLESAFNASGLAAEVDAFLLMAEAQNWINWNAS